LQIGAGPYLIVPIFVRELVVVGWVGALLIGPLLIRPWLIGPWLITRPEFVPLPVFRKRLPLPSLAFDTLYCATAAVPHANTKTIANVNLMCPL
jgi:hypothetical protein